MSGHGGSGHGTGRPHEPFAGFDVVAGGREPRPDAYPRVHASAGQWLRDLLMGARFAVGGGREGWIRTALTGIGVGLGVALLLLAAAVPAMLDARDHRRSARDPFQAGDQPKPTASTFLMRQMPTAWHDQLVSGVLLRPDGPAMVPPPGVNEVPPAGQMVVSPALREVLAKEPLMRERIPYKIAGTIGHAGLTGPSDLYYYATDDHLVPYDANGAHGNSYRTSAFGLSSHREAQGPVFALLLIMVVVVLLLPIAVFVAAAVRLGGERRDRRLAALRLVGCDIGGTHRIASGEALFGTVLGVLLGGLFFLVGRQFAADISIQGASAYPSDLTPDPALTVLIALAVPAAAVVVTVLSLRRTVIEPLGVFRQGLGRRRVVWWRIAMPLAGLALLAPQFGKVQGDAQLNQYQIATGAALLLVGVTAVLPWAVEATVRRLRGGPVAWQLAIRRLQLGGGSAGRMVSGVTVAVAGAIALQMLFHAVDGDFVTATGADPTRAQMEISSSNSSVALTTHQIQQLTRTKGVAEVTGYTSASTNGPGNDVPMVVSDCTNLRRLAAVTACGPGSVYLVEPSAKDTMDGETPAPLAPGTRLDLTTGNDNDDRPARPSRPWTVPRGTPTVAAHVDPMGGHVWGVLATPEAVTSSWLSAPETMIYVRLDKAGTPDAKEYVRTTAAGFGMSTYATDVDFTTTSGSYSQLRRGLFAGATLTLLLIGASLLVSMLEQLRDRKKLLAVLVAFGTRRGALAWSVLWQTAIPVALGLALAAVGGVGLGAALMAMTARPFLMDWGSVLTFSAIGAGVVLGVTLLSMPMLWRLMRADGLRTE